MRNVFPNQKTCLDCKRPAKNLCVVCKNLLPKWKSKFCSQLCYKTFIEESNPPKTCPECKSEFKFCVKQKYCSTSCSNTAKDRAKKAKNRAKKLHRQQFPELYREKARAAYVNKNRLEKKRKRRLLVTAARKAYKELMGIKPPLRVRLAENAPLVSIGDWASYIVLPSPDHWMKHRSSKVRQNVATSLLRRYPVIEISKYNETKGPRNLECPVCKTPIPPGRTNRRIFCSPTCQEKYHKQNQTILWASYVVLPQGQWRPWTNKPKYEIGLKHAGSYRSLTALKSVHFQKRRKRNANKKYYPYNKEKQRIRQRRDSAILEAFKDLNLLPTGELK